jgi:hypothetical protein
VITPGDELVNSGAGIVKWMGDVLMTFGMTCTLISMFSMKLIPLMIAPYHAYSGGACLSTPRFIVYSLLRSTKFA